METGLITGYIDEEIRYCPYCGNILDIVSLHSETICQECRKAFFVIEGESIEED